MWFNQVQFPRGQVNLKDEFYTLDNLAETARADIAWEQSQYCRYLFAGTWKRIISTGSFHTIRTAACRLRLPYKQIPETTFCHYRFSVTGIFEREPTSDLCRDKGLEDVKKCNRNEAPESRSLVVDGRFDKHQRRVQRMEGERLTIPRVDAGESAWYPKLNSSYASGASYGASSVQSEGRDGVYQ